MADQWVKDIGTFGEWVRQRRLTMRMTRAGLAKKVGCAEVTIKKIEREERHPSLQIAELLADHLEIPLALRDTFLSMAQGAFGALQTQPDEILLFPPFLQQTFPSSQNQPGLFLERQAELSRLDSYLRRALAGNGLPVFISGESGSGKTTLLKEFARLSQKSSPDLITAGGQCNAQSGVGDPYRPFRDILETLTGNRERFRWGIDQQQALRIWTSIPETVQTITVAGPHLVNLILPATPLIQRIAPYLTGSADWLRRLEALNQSGTSDRSMIDQMHIVEEITQTLLSISMKHPLLILIDDLQWVDDTSKNLLYHFGRRLKGSRILLLCACRLDDLSALATKTSTSSDEFPIQSLIRELSRYYGDILIDLDQPDPARDRAFCDALINSEATTLDSTFRETFYRFTQGQPLFSVELLHHLQDHHFITQDGEGKWTVQEGFEGGPLPARIEAVIAQRLTLLPELHARNVGYCQR